jgi:hypothetical protein
MPLIVDAIKFNHNSASASNDAFNIRRNATQFVSVPEWQNGVSVHPEDSLAAYAIEAVGKNTITIQARFLVKPLIPKPKTSTLEIQAISIPPGPFPWPTPKLVGPLGNVAPTQVKFNAKGDSGWVTMNLTGHLAGGVRVGNITWQWQARLKASDPWKDFAQTRHRIYVVVDIPELPWMQTPYDPTNKNLPWSDVLDYSCAWAHASTTLDQAAGLVTEHVYALGPGTVTYDCPGGGGSHYTVAGNFNCTAFLDRLHGGPGNGIYVNCTDCATFVATFSNILGDDLWESRMGYNFGLNPMLGIGSSVWQPCCGWPGFYYHEVAWEGGCTQSDDIFDACLEVNGGPDPAQPPYVPLLPKDMLFGAPGQSYRYRLATAASQNNCNPDPSTRIRRALM